VIFIYNGIFSAIKNEILLFADKWIEQGNIILREVSQVPKAKNDFSHMWNINLIQIQQYYEKQVIIRGGH
jgi:hypothetical protein